MGRSIRANLLVMGGLVGHGPHHSRGFQVAAMLGHLCRQYFQKWVRIGYTRSSQESVGCAAIIFQVVINEAEIVVKMPVIGVVANTVFD